MKKLCLVFGGDSVENEISVLTALKVHKELEKYSYPHELVYLDHEGVFYSGPALFNKNNYHHKLNFKKVNFYKNKGKTFFKFKHQKVEFDAVLLLVHGANAEDGTIGGYFDTLKIPCIYPGLQISSLLQDKSVLKAVLETLNIPQVKYLELTEKEFEKEIDNSHYGEDFSYPLIVKPNKLGSSIGVTKIEKKEELIQGLIEAFKFDNKVLIEECVLNLIEVNVAICKKNDELLVSMTERVNNNEKILSFIDKYDNYSFNEKHIIPADVDKKINKKVVFLAKKVYSKLQINSVVRFDFLIDSKSSNVYLNEINAIPGSLAYYLFEKNGIQLIDLIEIIVEQYELDNKKNNKKIHAYKEEWISSLKEK